MFHGYFINLDRSRDRLIHVQSELARFNLSDRYERLRGIPNVLGTVGCYHSHLKALDLVRRQEQPVHIIEDDVIFSAEAIRFLGSSEMAGILEKVDILYLDMWVDPEPRVVRRYQGAMLAGGPMDLRGSRIGCVSSYVVSPSSARKLLRLLRGKTPPIDNLISRLVEDGEVTAAVMVPFLTGIEIGFGSRSQIQSISSDEQRRYVMMRTAFFVDRDRQPSFSLPALPAVG